MNDYTITFHVKAERPADARDLGDELRRAFDIARKRPGDPAPYMSCAIERVSVQPSLDGATAPQPATPTTATATAVASDLPWWARTIRWFFPVYWVEEQAERCPICLRSDRGVLCPRCNPPLHGHEGFE